jgi:hypothetical protein
MTDGCGRSHDFWMASSLLRPSAWICEAAHAPRVYSRTHLAVLGFGWGRLYAVRDARPVAPSQPAAPAPGDLAPLTLEP